MADTDERIAGYMENAAIMNNDMRPKEPSHIMYDHNGSQAAGDETESRCKSWAPLHLEKKVS